MKWEKMNEFIANYPKSTTAKIYLDEEQNISLTTHEEVLSAIINSPTAEEDILAIIHGWIENAMCKYTGCNMYIRVPPEIELHENGRSNKVYCRIQFAEAVAE